jgi:hypothetical protein
MIRLCTLLLALLATSLPQTAAADPSDISTAARGVVRVVIIGTDGERVFPVSHGTGFAVTPTRIVTNAHVVREAQLDDTMRIGIVPSDGDEATYAKIVTVSPRNDLALLEITGDLRLPPLTIAGGSPGDGSEVSAVGYPMNVDLAQGLDISDIFKPQPPVKSRGYLSGVRPSRQFDTVLHTAPIARGNSGGPLLDACGRVLGVNSFGADAGEGDAEFYFAVSDRELLPFLRSNSVTPAVNALPCRSLADLDEAEAERIAREQAEARQALAARAEDSRAKRDRARLEAEMAVMDERENAMAFALVLLLVAAGAGATAWQLKRGQAEDRKVYLAGGVAAVALIASLALWFTRPGLDAIDQRVNAAMEEDQPADDGAGGAAGAGEGAMLCTIDVSRSRVTGDAPQDLAFEWNPDGCVNGRTQYGLSGGEWSRLFVPNEEDTVSVNRYDPESRSFRTDRYLLSRSTMAKAREERARYHPPACGAGNAASDLGEMQSAIVALLPDRPNERLVYQCEAKMGG